MNMMRCINKGKKEQLKLPDREKMEALMIRIKQKKEHRRRRKKKGFFP